MELNKNSIHPKLFNLDQLNRIGNNDETFNEYMVNKFITIASECSENLHSAVMAKDWAKIRHVVHKNLPSYSIMEINDVVEIMKYIELNAEKLKDHEEMMALSKSIFEKNTRVIEAMKEYLNSVKTPELHPDKK